MSYYAAKRLDTAYQAARSALKGPVGPFSGWLVSGRGWESFNSEGRLLDSDAHELGVSSTTSIIPSENMQVEKKV